MKIGMMWFDNSKTPLSKKIGEASSYYEHKYGHRPTLAIVNPATAIDECNIEVETARHVLPNHIWLGVED